jgi:hypothetical protein
MSSACASCIAIGILFQVHHCNWSWIYVCTPGGSGPWALVLVVSLQCNWLLGLTRVGVRLNQGLGTGTQIPNAMQCNCTRTPCQRLFGLVPWSFLNSIVLLVAAAAGWASYPWLHVFTAMRWWKICTAWWEQMSRELIDRLTRIQCTIYRQGSLGFIETS